MRKQSKTLKHYQGKQYSKATLWLELLDFPQPLKKNPNLVVLGIPFKSNEQASFDLQLAEKLESQFEQLLGCDYQYNFEISWKSMKKQPTLWNLPAWTEQTHPALPL